MAIAMTAEFETARMIEGLVAGEATQDAEEACGELRERVVSRRRSCQVSSRSAPSSLSKGRFFVPYFLVAQSTRLGAAIAVPPFVFEKNAILPRFLPVPPFLVFVSLSLVLRFD